MLAQIASFVSLRSGLPKKVFQQIACPILLKAFYSFALAEFGRS